MTRATLAMVVSPIVAGSRVPTWDGALWVGEVDRADVHASSHRDVVVLRGGEGYTRARLLVRDHGEPVGFVEADVTERRRLGATIDVRTLQRAIRPMPAPERRPAAGQDLPSVTVVLCTDGAAGETMRSVLANDHPAFDVVVVSHGADEDQPTTVVVGGRRVHTIAAPSGGLAAARNAGLLAATGDLVAFVDEGAVVDRGWLSALASASAVADDVACVTGMVPSAELRTPAQRWRDDRTPAARTVRRRVHRMTDTVTDPETGPRHPFAASEYGTGANLAVHRLTALRLGGFDTAFGPGTRTGGGDDLDLFTRLLVAGSAIAVEPAAIAWQRTADDVASLRGAAAAHGHGLGAWMTKNAFDRETATDSLDALPDAVSAFARLGLEPEDRDADVVVAGHAGGTAAAGTPDAVDAAFAGTARRLRRVEQRSVLTGGLVALGARLGGAGTIDRTAHGRHELRRGLAGAGDGGDTADAGAAHEGSTPWSDDASRRAVASDAMGPVARLVAAGLVVLALVLAAVGSVAGLPTLRGSAVGVFMFALLGVAPMLLVRPMPLARFAVFSVTASLVGTIGIGYTMATFGIWQPVGAFVGVVVLTAAAVAVAVPRDVAELRRRLLVAPAGRPARQWHTGHTVTAMSIVGLLVVVVTAVTHTGDPVRTGLFGSLGVGLVVGLALVVAAAVVALVRGRAAAVPVVVLGGVVQLAQAITYGMPTVMAAARHVGVIEYIRRWGSTNPAADIFQTWSGLFAGTAWTADVGGITNVMTVAAWVPVLLAFSTTAAVGVLAARWLPGARRPWIAALLTAMTGSLNTTYFSPQSTGILMSIVILVLATGPLRRTALTREDGTTTTVLRARKVPLSRIVAITAIGVVLTVTHQISPYLTVAALVTLVVFRLLRPWWLPVVVLVPAVGFALLNGDVLGKFVSIAAVGRVLDNVQPPAHDMTVLPKPLVTALAFDVPAAALVVLGLVALVTVLLRRDRLHWGLLAAAASPISLLVATNYGQEGIFRVVLFATPWIAILAAGLPNPSGRLAPVGRAVARVGRPTAVRFVVAGAVVAALVGVGAFGQTALDWNRVMTRSQSAATQWYDATAPKGSVMLLTGSANAVPSNTGARYFDVGYLSREALGDYPEPTGYDAQADVADVTKELVLDWSATKYYALVAEPFGAYDERYGYQTDQDYQELAAAMATSPYWEKVWSSGTTVVYQLTQEGVRHAAT